MFVLPFAYTFALHDTGPLNQEREQLIDKILPIATMNAENMNLCELSELINFTARRWQTLNQNLALSAQPLELA